MGVEIIAEVKTRSPFGFVSDHSWDELFAVANDIGDIISIHIDARWGGSLDMVKEARARSHKPILAKGIHETDEEVERALEAGADYVLVVGRIPMQNRDRCFIEPNTLNELRVLPSGVRAVWNSRDLATGGLKSERFEDARALHSGWLCQASNIRTIDDIQPGADAILVGTHLLSFAQSLR